MKKINGGGNKEDSSILAAWCRENNKLYLLDEWDYEKNGTITPEMVARGSGKKAWWKCERGHEWETSIKNRTMANSGCPICDGKIILQGFNDLATWCMKNDKTYLLDEWDYEKNGELTPQSVAPKTSRKVWWRCEKGHHWQASVLKRSDGRGCPVCSNRLICTGINDLATWCREHNRQDILDEWDYEKNGDLTPQSMAPKTSKKVWWRCDEGHSFTATVAHRVKDKSGCPVCAGNTVQAGFNDFATWCNKNNRLYLLDEWDYEKNGDLTPQTVAPKTSKRVWWKCDKGHSYEAPIAQRTDKDCACPICAGQEVKIGFNDFATWCTGNDKTYLLDEWDYDNNGILTPEMVTKSTGRRVWWRCSKGHSWSATLASRTYKDIGCPYCSNRKVLSGYNDFKTWCEQNNRRSFLNEWDYEKNDTVSPDMVTKASNKRVWWKCEKGHSWSVPICTRTGDNTGCPFCSGSGTSFPEQAVAYYVSKSFSIKQRYKIKGFEFDVFLEEYSIGIEYDGIFYHSKERVINREKQKDSFSQSNGIKLIRIKENRDRTAIEGDTIFYSIAKSRAVYLDDAFNYALRLLMVRLEEITEVKTFKDIDTARDELLIRERYAFTSKEGSLAAIRPDLIQEWNTEKNRDLSPESFSVGSNMKVWWKCSKGHEWEASINNRSGRNTGCPICDGKIILRGFNDLATWCLNNDKMHLLDEWDYEKNGTLTPENVAAKVSKKVWWKCEKGHSWQARIGNRTNGNCCPVCANKIILPGFNDLASWCRDNNREDLLNEWDYEKNDELSPNTIGPNSSKKVWWRCAEGHQWQTTVYNRKKGLGCPVCSNHTVLAGFNDLATWCMNNDKMHLLDEWDYEKNGELTPQSVAPKTSKKVWWRCEMGHSWKASINSRTQLKSGCPVCSGRAKR